MFKLFQFLVTNPKTCGNITNIPGKIPKLSSEVFTLIEIAVPVLLVIMGTMDLFKGITANKEDEMAKGRKIFVKRLITGALVFFIIAITKFLINLVDNDNSTSIIGCINCFINNECKSTSAIKAIENYDKKVEEHNNNFKSWKCTLNGITFDVSTTGEGFAQNLTGELKVTSIDNPANWKPSEVGECPSADKYVANVYKIGNEKLFDLMTKEQSVDKSVTWECKLNDRKMKYTIDGITRIEVNSANEQYGEVTSEFKPKMVYECPSSSEYKVVTGASSKSNEYYFKVTKK